MNSSVEDFWSLFKPLPKQITFLKSLRSHRYVLYGGARGGGKSKVLRWALLWLLLEWFWTKKIRNVRVGLFCEDYPTLRDRQIGKIKVEFPAWLGSVKETQEDGLGFFLKPEYGGGAILLRNLDDPSKYQCYHPDTELLTERGFVPVANVAVGDILATMDPQTRVVTYQPATKVHAYDFDGELIETPQDKSHVAFSVTPNHRMLCRTARGALRFFEAQDLPSEFCVPRSGLFSGETPAFFDVPAQPLGRNKKPLRIPIVPWLKFLGWYLSEGSTYLGRYATVISQVKEEGRAAIEEMLSEFPYSHHRQAQSFTVSGKALCLYLRSLGADCYSKRIPREILALHPDLLQHLFAALMMGDGTATASGGYVFTSTSRGLVDDVSELAIRLGYVPTVLPIGGKGRFPNAKPAWHISITRRGDTRCRRSLLQRRPYIGKVHCVTVLPHHTVLTRYRNRVMWCGQSAEFAAVAVEELTKNPKETFDILRGSLRWPGIAWTLFMAATNPGGVGHSWVQSLWLTGDFPPEMEKIREQFTFVQSLPSDNPHLSESYWEELNSLPEQLRRAWVEGRWDAFLGQAFSEWRASVHVRKEPERLPPGWRCVAGGDWGSDRPGWLGICYVGPEGRRHWRWEMYFGPGTKLGKMAPYDVGKRFGQEIQGRFASPEFITLGDAAWVSVHNGVQVRSVAAEMERGLYNAYGRKPFTAPPLRSVNEKTQSSRENRKTVVHSALEWRPGPDEDDPTRNLPPWHRPKMTVHPDCANLIRTLPVLPVDEKDPTKIDKKSEDHPFDAVSNCLSTLPFDFVEEDTAVEVPDHVHPGFREDGRRKKRPRSLLESLNTGEGTDVRYVVGAGDAWGEEGEMDL